MSFAHNETFWHLLNITLKTAYTFNFFRWAWLFAVQTLWYLTTDWFSYGLSSLWNSNHIDKYCLIERGIFFHLAKTSKTILIEVYGSFRQMHSPIESLHNIQQGVIKSKKGSMGLLAVIFLGAIKCLVQSPEIYVFKHEE